MICGMNLSNESLCALLHAATEEERGVLTRVIYPQASNHLNALRLQEAVCGAGGNKFANLIRSGGIGYLEIVSDVGALLRIPNQTSIFKTPTLGGVSLFRMDWDRAAQVRQVDITRCAQEVREYIELAEKAIMAKVMAEAYEKMSLQDKILFDRAVSDAAAKYGQTPSVRGLTGVTAAMALAQVGGFATYTLMSSVLSIASFGTLGFPVYTAASSLLSAVIGPVGWVALGGAFAYKFGKPKDHTVIMLVLYIAMIRQRLAYEASQAAKPKPYTPYTFR